MHVIFLKEKKKKKDVSHFEAVRLLESESALYFVLCST